MCNILINLNRKSFTFNYEITLYNIKQAGAELCQAQFK
jgi:hypothetical protein